MSKAVSKNFFLISFLPAIAYWYLEANYPVRIAVAGGLILACLEMLFEKIFTGHLHSLSKFNFFLIAFLGGISLIGDEGIWFKLQPCLTGLGIGGYLFFRMIRGRGLLLEMMESMGKEIPSIEIVNMMEKHVGLFFITYGSFMGFVAFKLSTDQWLFYKTLGFYIIFAVFMLFEMVIIRLTVKKIIKKNRKKALLERFKVS